jgi:hypothetical protein
VLRKLHHHATTKLGLAPRDAKVAGRYEAVDVVNAMFEAGLSGRLVFDLPEDATEERVVRYLCGKLRTMRSTYHHPYARTLHDEALHELLDETPDAVERLSGFRLAAAFRRAFEHDAEASAFLEVLAEPPEDDTRAGIAKALGWTVQRVKAVRNRIARTLAAREPTMNDNGEDEPQSSIPRGDDHAQTPEERRGAPHEPHRRAGGARRRG